MAPCYLKEIISNTAYKELITLLEEYSKTILESWRSKADNNSINERKELTRVYKAFVKQNA